MQKDYLKGRVEPSMERVVSYKMRKRRSALTRWQALGCGMERRLNSESYEVHVSCVEPFLETSINAKPHHTLRWLLGQVWLEAEHAVHWAKQARQQAIERIQPLRQEAGLEPIGSVDGSIAPLLQEEPSIGPVAAGVDDHLDSCVCERVRGLVTATLWDEHENVTDDDGVFALDSFCRERERIKCRYEESGVPGERREVEPGGWVHTRLPLPLTTAHWMGIRYGHFPVAGEASVLEMAGGEGAWTTPLHLATYEANAPIVEALLRHGADPTVLDAWGHTAVELASIVAAGYTFSSERSARSRDTLELLTSSAEAVEGERRAKEEAWRKAQGELEQAVSSFQEAAPVFFAVASGQGPGAPTFDDCSGLGLALGGYELDLSSTLEAEDIAPEARLRLTVHPERARIARALAESGQGGVDAASNQVRILQDCLELEPTAAACVLDALGASLSDGNARRELDSAASLVESFSVTGRQVATVAPLVHSGLCEALVEVMENHGESPIVAITACRLIELVCRDDVECGRCRGCQEARRRFSLVRGAVAGVRAESGMDQLGEAGAVEALNTILLTHTTDDYPAVAARAAAAYAIGEMSQGVCLARSCQAMPSRHGEEEAALARRRLLHEPNKIRFNRCGIPERITALLRQQQEGTSRLEREAGAAPFAYAARMMQTQVQAPAGENKCAVC